MKLLPGDFPQEVLPQPLDQTQATSSQSSLRSLSMEKNADYPPFLLNMLHVTSSYPPFSNQQAPNQTPSSSTMRSEDPLQQALNQIRSNQLIPSREHEEAAMTRAIIEAISSSSSSIQSPRPVSAFKRYQTYLGSIKRVQNSQNLNRRSLAFFRNLSKARAQQEQQMVHTTRPTSNQLHHMISERKRREKLNDSFQALRSLLPPGSKVCIYIQLMFLHNVNMIFIYRPLHQLVDPKISNKTPLPCQADSMKLLRWQVLDNERNLVKLLRWQILTT